MTKASDKNTLYTTYYDSPNELIKTICSDYCDDINYYTSLKEAKEEFGSRFFKYGLELGNCEDIYEVTFKKIASVKTQQHTHYLKKTSE